MIITSPKVTPLCEGSNTALCPGCVCPVASLYLNPLSNVGKQSLYVRGVPSDQGGTGRRVQVLASVTEGSDLSESWHPILSVITENASTWDRQRVREQLQVRFCMCVCVFVYMQMCGSASPSSYMYSHGCPEDCLKSF